MTLLGFKIRVTNALRGSLSSELTLLLALIAVLLAMAIANAAYFMGFADGQTSAIANFTISGGVNFVASARIGVIVCLLVCFAGSCFRNLWGIATSMLGTLWLLFLYFWWRHQSLMFLKNAEVPDFASLQSQWPNIGGLWGSTSLDIVVFGSAAILFLWQALILLRAAKITVFRPE
jgi:hypothetical protein